MLNIVRSAKSRSSRCADQTRRESGAAAVEFALVMPFLLALIFGMINFGFIFAAQISLNSAARDAARAGVVKPITPSATGLICSAIATNARANAGTIGVDTSTIIVNVAGPNGLKCNLTGAVFSGNDVPMCSATNGQVVVVLKYVAVSPAPLVPPTSATLTAIGAFQCEY